MDFISGTEAAKIRKTLHLIRHGETDFNRQNIIQGSGIDSDLNDQGRAQAQAFYESYKHIPFHKIYTSCLKRTLQSVEPFLSKAGVPHTPMKEFNEINWGDMEGKVGSRENTEMYDRMIASWTSGNLDTSVLGGETPNEMFKRQAEGMKKVMQATDEEQIMICMHGRALRSFLCLLTNTPLKEMEKWQHSNLCLYVLEFNGVCFDVVLHNDTRHLGGD